MQQLVDKLTKEPLVIGQTVKTFRGDDVKLMSMQPPRHCGSEGHVCIRYAGAPAKFDIEVYASVINAVYVEAL
jgi:hypothetical protein